MNEKELTKRQTEMHDKIFNHAKENNLIKQKPLLMPIYDGVADIKAYISSNPKIMWILKEPYDDFTSTGKADPLQNTLIQSEALALALGKTAGGEG